MEKIEKSVNECSSKLEKQPMNTSTDSSTNNINPGLLQVLQNALKE